MQETITPQSFHLGTFWAPFEDKNAGNKWTPNVSFLLGPNLDHVGAMLGPKWTVLGPRWDQLGPQVDPKAPSWGGPRRPRGGIDF